MPFNNLCVTNKEKVLMAAQSVGNVSRTNQNNSSQRIEKPVQITIKQGDTISSLAKKFGMKPDEFKQWVGLKSNTVKLGQKINLPNDTVPEGKGILALARKYNMTLEEFGKLNNLPKPYKEYSAAKGEKFYVKSKNSAEPAKKTTTTPKNKPAAPKTNSSKSKTQAKPDESSALSAGAKIGAAAISEMVERQRKWGSSYTPQELADKIYQGSKKVAAVGKPDFDALINEINPKNVEEVLKAYTKKESLVNTITSEVMSDKKARKNAVMHIYDALAKAKGTSASKRKEFETELNKQFDSWGMVNTKKMDEMINEMLGKSPAEKSTTSNTPTSSTPVLVKSKPADNTKVTVSKTDKKTKKTITKTFTASELQKGAIADAKDKAKEQFKKYCADNGIKYDEKLLDLTPMERIPAPVIKNGVMAMQETEVLKPTAKPNGKVIILNAGHGGYSSRTGYFDPGSYSFIQKANGKYAPLLEYEKAKIYADSTTEKLRAQGYSVVITSGHSETMSDRDSMTKLVKGLTDGTKGKQRFNKKDIMMISLHADSQPGSTGSGVCFQPGTADDNKLKDILLNSLNQDNWIKASEQPRNWGSNGVGILNQTKDIPSVLLEIEYVNGCKSKNLDSPAYQARFETQIIKGINEYFNIK